MTSLSEQIAQLRSLREKTNISTLSKKTFIKKLIKPEVIPSTNQNIEENINVIEKSRDGLIFRNDSNIFDKNTDKNRLEEGHTDITLSERNNREHSKFKATVQLLLESLEEQGRLRALLDYTCNPNILKEIESSEYNSTKIKDLIQFRGRVLEFENMVKQLTSLRSEHEEEKYVRTQTEKSLIILQEQLKIAEQKVENLTVENQELKQYSKELITENHSMRRHIQQCPHCTARPMADPTPANPAKPPLPSGPSQRDGPPQSVVQQTGATKAAPSDTLSSVPRPQHGLHDTITTTTATSTVRSIALEIHVGEGHTERIRVTADDDPLLLAFSFLEQHGLAAQYLEPLAAYIISTQASLSDNQHDQSQPEEHKADDTATVTAIPTGDFDPSSPDSASSRSSDEHSLDYSCSEPSSPLCFLSDDEEEAEQTPADPPALATSRYPSGVDADQLTPLKPSPPLSPSTESPPPPPPPTLYPAAGTLPSIATRCPQTPDKTGGGGLLLSIAIPNSPDAASIACSAAASPVSPPPPPPPSPPTTPDSKSSDATDTNMSDPYRLAVKLFDRATDLVNMGNKQAAEPLYLHALALFECISLPESEMDLLKKEVRMHISPIHFDTLL